MFTVLKGQFSPVHQSLRETLDRADASQCEPYAVDAKTTAQLTADESDSGVRQRLEAQRRQRSSWMHGWRYR